MLQVCVYYTVGRRGLATRVCGLRISYLGQITPRKRCLLISAWTRSVKRHLNHWKSMLVVLFVCGLTQRALPPPPEPPRTGAQLFLCGWNRYLSPPPFSCCLGLDLLTIMARLVMKYSSPVQTRFVPSRFMLMVYSTEVKCNVTSPRASRATGCQNVAVCRPTSGSTPCEGEAEQTRPVKSIWEPDTKATMPLMDQVL